MNVFSVSRLKTPGLQVACGDTMFGSVCSLLLTNPGVNLRYDTAKKEASLWLNVYISSLVHNTPPLDVNGSPNDEVMT